MKFAKTIRFDKSDLNIFPLASEEGELAIVGTFNFYNLKQDDLKGKVKQAFSNGFIGLQSFGFSTLVSVATAKKQDLETIETILAERFIREFGAPDNAAARVAAQEELGFMADLCAEHQTGTLLAVQRSLTDAGISETFRSLPKPESCAEQKIWTIVSDDDAK